MNFFVSVWLLAVMLLPQKGGDVLSLVPTQAYWEARNVQVTPELLQSMARGQSADIAAQIKALSSEVPAEREAAIRAIAAAGAGAAPQLQELSKSTDPRLAKLASNLLQQVKRRGNEGRLNRLMAIRTLGEMKVAASLPLLQELSSSKEAFVPEYAAAAISRIEGKPLAPRPAVSSQAREKDLWLLPADSGLVAQLDLTSGLLAPGREPAPAAAATRPAATQLARMLRGALMGLDQIGNLRIDTVTVGVSSRAGDNQGWFVLIGRGRYDLAALTDLLRRQGAKISTAGGQTMYSMGGHAQFILPDENTLVLVTGASPAEVADLKMAEVLKGGEGALKGNEAMVAALNVTDRSAPLYATAMMSDAYRALPLQLPLPFEMLRLTAKPREGKLVLKLEGEGSDPAAVAEAAAAYRKLVETGIQGLGVAAGAGTGKDQPSIQMALDFLNSVKIETAEMHLTITAQLDLSGVATAMDSLALQ